MCSDVSSSNSPILSSILFPTPCGPVSIYSIFLWWLLVGVQGEKDSIFLKGLAIGTLTFHRILQRVFRLSLPCYLSCTSLVKIKVLLIHHQRSFFRQQMGTNREPKLDNVPRVGELGTLS
ncbi:hypothetical protein STEG23_027369, partial [Scotinomys teguina]